MNLKLLKKKILKLKNDCVQTCALMNSTENISYGNDDASLADYLKTVKMVKEFENELFIINKMEEIGKKYTFNILLKKGNPNEF